jgi:hypothetical protein
MNRDDKITQLTNLANQMRDKQRTIDKLQKQLEQTQYEFNTLSSHEIPIIMSDLRMSQFTLDDGTFFAVVPVLKVTASKDRMDEIDDWLSNNGHSGLVRTHIDVNLPRGSNKLAEITQKLDTIGIQYEVNKAINYQTLNKWAREMETEGMVIPDDLFGVFRSNKTIIE